ncbi:MAG TPA: sulfite exporter TauE/SafE family protein [Burkholderiales bacterium]|nr:sulfite exporter TauE/SafE family protein [Burkholderiales bacterium]
MGLACIAAILLAGWLIGATGIGGVLVVPALTRLEGITLPQAVAASAAAFAFPAAAALAFLVIRRTHLRGALWLSAGALAGAALGASLVHRLDVRVLLALVTALLLFAGLYALRGLRETTPRSNAPELPVWALLAVGAVVGIGSALTGTGGPVLLSPLLVLLRQPLAAVIASANAIQMPVAIAASVVHWQSGALDIGLAAMIGLALLAAAVVGQISGAAMHTRRLQRLVAGLLLVVGAGFGWTLIAEVSR